MDHGSQFIFLGAFLMMLSMLAGQLSSRLGAPVLLTFLAVGILFGENGPGGIVFNDKNSAFLICSIALAMILFDGGLRTHMSQFKIAVKPAFMLSTLGVLITASITAAFAIWLMGLNTLHGFLLGSIVASTDAAAVFLLLHQRGIHLKERVSATLEVESGINDPMAVFLTFTCVSLITASTAPTWVSIAGLFIQQMGLGLLLGYAGGMSLTALLRFVRFGAGLYPVVVLTGGLLIFGGTNMVGGSGFLAVYLAGVTFANSGYQKISLIKHFNDGMAWIAQLVMLLTLGLLVTPSKLVEYIIPAVLIAVVLIVVARPVAVGLSLIKSGFSWKEKSFISWVGLRGAIPIYLALIPALSGVENGQFYFNVAFIIVSASLLLQGWAINPLARWLRITTEKPIITD
ncbi:MAG: potassium/proton antiporter [Pseudomonadota bacterium]